MLTLHLNQGNKLQFNKWVDVMQRQQTDNVCICIFNEWSKSGHLEWCWIMRSTVDSNDSLKNHEFLYQFAYCCFAYT